MSTKDPGRRKFLKDSALFGLTAGALTGASALRVDAASQSNQAPASKAPSKDRTKELIAYGERSRFVKSIRIPVAERDSPDMFGLMFHVSSPIQDQTGIITPSSLHYIGTHRGSYLPDIDPQEHRLLIHGMVDRPLIFTVDDLKRFPSVTRVHYLECSANHPHPGDKTVQETHGMTSCSEYRGVLVSELLKEAGVQSGAGWIVPEGSEEVKGGSSIRLAKAMDDCLVAYAQNGEALRPHQGFPMRLVVPGFEGIYHTKWLRRIKVTDKHQMTYNDYGHLGRDPKSQFLGMVNGPKSVITFPSGGQKLSGPGFYEISGLAYSGGGVIAKVEVSTDGGQTWKDAELRSPAHPMAHTLFGFNWNWDGKECELQSRCTDELGQVQPSRAQVLKFYNLPQDYFKTHRSPGQDNIIHPWTVTSDGGVHNAFA